MLEDGTCQWGFPDLLPENVAAFDLFTDINLLGWEAATSLRDWTLDRHERDDLLTKLRTLASEARTIESERMKRAGSGGTDKTRR